MSPRSGPVALLKQVLNFFPLTLYPSKSPYSFLLISMRKGTVWVPHLRCSSDPFWYPLDTPSRQTCQVDLNKMDQSESCHQKWNILLILAFIYHTDICALGKVSQKFCFFLHYSLFLGNLSHACEIGVSSVILTLMKLEIIGGVH